MVGSSVGDELVTESSAFILTSVVKCITLLVRVNNIHNTNFNQVV